MPLIITPFESNLHHIHTTFFVTHPKTGSKHSFEGIIDTGAPCTEFSDVILVRAGFIRSVDQEIKIKSGLQTQKYGKTILPKVKICGQDLNNFEVFVSKLDESWGIDALIGLDFFKRFRVTIDYKAGHLVTEPL